MIATIAVGIQDRPPTAPPGPWTSDYKIVDNSSFTKAITGVSSIVFAYCGTPGKLQVLLVSDVVRKNTSTTRIVYS